MLEDILFLACRVFSLNPVLALNISILILWCPQEALQDEIKALEGRVSSIQVVLGDLKIQLYAKFGNNINLEAEES